MRIDNGNLVIVDDLDGATVYWRSGTQTATQLVFRPSGSLVLLNARGQVVWGPTPYCDQYSPVPALQDDPNVVVYCANIGNGTVTPRTVAWATGTSR